MNIFTQILDGLLQAVLRMNSLYNLISSVTGGVVNGKTITFSGFLLSIWVMRDNIASAITSILSQTQAWLGGVDSFPGALMGFAGLWLPLDYILFSLGSYLILMVSVTIIRVVKGFIPTLG